MKFERLNSIEDLHAYRQRLMEGFDASKRRVRICMTGCQAYGAREVRNAFLHEIEAAGLKGDVEVLSTGCHGLCACAPVVVIDPDEIFYRSVQVEDVRDIVMKTLKNGEVVERLLYSDPSDGETYVHMSDIPFYKLQTRWVLRNCGRIDPTDINHYIMRGGYSALEKVLKGASPEQVIEEVKRAGLRGRGGAGFPTGLKWQLTREAKGEPKYLICNADEGDPGAFMDRALLEGDPHSVLEGMLIGAYAIGANEGYIYVRAEYPIAVRHLEIAISQAEQLGLIGDDILGTGFSFHITLKKGAGAFVCGEETALIASIEGKRGMPRQRPPFPAQSGLWGKPTCINNVETFANIPIIIHHGADEYAKVGTERSKGTKIFALAGKVVNTGLVEVPIGTPLRTVIFDIGGGVARGRRFKAVQIGGPSGGCIPARYIDLPIDYESLTAAGAIMGSGGMVVMDDNTCMVDVARFFLEFTQSESCGKCVPCRIGTRRMLEILERITRGHGTEDDVDLLREVGEMVKEASLCGLGQTAPNPVLSTIRYFADEYVAHIVEKRCPACICEALFISPCQHACPAGINIPRYVSLISEGRFKEALLTILDRIPLPGVCGRVCHAPCESKCRRWEVDEPVAIRALKRFVADVAWDEAIAEIIEEAKRVPKRDKKVAIIGAGPAGLTAAYHLARKGYPVTVYEATSFIGGMLVLGIPSYRLPKDVIERELELLKALGIEILTNAPIGDGMSLDDLRNKGYHAIFIAVGAHDSPKLSIPGEELEGVVGALEFLRNVNAGAEMRIGERVAVIGGGNSAVDAARVVLRMGASEVTVIYRRRRAEMPAIESEVEEAEREGVKFMFLTAPKRFIGDERIRAIECVKMKLGEYDESGRRRAIPLEGSEFQMPIDQVIVAVGQVARLPFIEGKLEVDPLTLATQFEGIFAGGDVVTGPATVIEAMAGGLHAAESIDRYLRGVDLKEGRFVPPPLPTEEVLYEIEPSEAPRYEIPTLPLEQRRRTFEEIERPYDAETAMEEGKRCLRCDLERGK